MHHAQHPGHPEDALPHIPEGPPWLVGNPSPGSRTAGPWQLPSSPAACRRARVAVREILADWDLEHHTHTAELLVSELVGNALLHAGGPLHLRVEHRNILRCHVTDGSTRPPLLRSAAPDDENGRGLELVHLLSHNWGVEHTARGKSVWFELG
ncbi:ATP-binding protein [Streptomyces sp. NPDC001922]|uniref:ATP-binding protein n=1 Tax=Streptomyces sp. NPDC001922 TaxID=3364624 RepID=UPI00369D0B6A